MVQSAMIERLVERNLLPEEQLMHFSVDIDEDIVLERVEFIDNSRILMEKMVICVDRDVLFKVGVLHDEMVWATLISLDARVPMHDSVFLFGYKDGVQNTFGFVLNSI